MWLACSLICVGLNSPLFLIVKHTDVFFFFHLNEYVEFLENEPLVNFTLLKHLFAGRKDLQATYSMNVFNILHSYLLI